MKQNEPSKITLTRDESATFHRDGFLGPYAAYTPKEMEPLREHTTALLGGDAPWHSSNVEQSRHMDDVRVWEMCSRPAIVERMATLFGPDLLLWRSNFFNKEPGGVEIPWHQDYNYWPIEPAVNISAWLAVDEATIENSCVQIIPGSHRTILPHVQAPEGMGFSEMADMRSVDESQAANMILKPGEFFLFNERTLHRSAPNSSGKRRIGLAVRVTIPMVNVDHDQLFKDHGCIQLRGEDKMGFNRLVDPPIGR